MDDKHPLAGEIKCDGSFKNFQGVTNASLARKSRKNNFRML
nr:unnamed protein product [Callosobruchus analis]